LESSSDAEAADALDAATATGRAIDLVIIDSDLPRGADGSLARRLRTDPALRGTKLLLIKSNGADTFEDFNESIPVISRPVKRDALFSALEKTLRSERAEETATSSSLPDQLPAVRPRILVAEDNLVNQRLAMRMLEKLGYTAHVVANGLQAVESLTASTYHAILMDCQMPEMDGYEATRLIRERHPRLPIIAMTANAMQGDQQKCLEAGMTDYLSKPMRLQMLEAALKRCLAEVSTVPA
jgi:CheY-like chemotaxis protein